MDYKSPPIGNEISCVFHGIEDKFIQLNYLEELLRRSLLKDNFTIMDFQIVKFGDIAGSLNFILAESHLIVHTYPEYNCFYVSFYTCRGPKDAEKVLNYIKKGLEFSLISDFSDKKIVVDPNF